MSLDGRIAVVTGAGMGIGRASALRLARDGADVVGLDRDALALETLAEELGRSGARCLTLPLDVTDDEAVVATFARIEREFGGVDILVNNVGQSARERASEFWRSEPDVWDFTLEISLRSTLLCARQAAPGMRQRRRGRIINMASESAYYGNGMSADYSAAKAGVIGFTRALAGELAPFQVTVNAIAPGLTRTRVMDQLPTELVRDLAEKIPMGFIGEPDDVANAVAFFASDDSRFVTGQTLLVNGGRWMI